MSATPAIPWISLEDSKILGIRVDATTSHLVAVRVRQCTDIKAERIGFIEAISLNNCSDDKVSIVLPLNREAAVELLQALDRLIANADNETSI